MTDRARRAAPATIVVVVVLALVWTALVGRATAGVVALGIGVAVGLRALLGERPAPPARPGRISPVAAIRFLLVAAADLVTGSMSVAADVVTPRSRARPGLVRAPMRCDAPAVLTAVAHAISAAPGSVTLEVQHDPPALDVHVLRLGDADDVRAHAARLEELAARALGRDVTPAPRARAAPDQEPPT